MTGIVSAIPGPLDADHASVDEPLRDLRHEMALAADGVRALDTVLGPLRDAAGGLLASARDDLAERASIAAIGKARLLTNVVTLNGPASRRLRVRRARVGAAIQRPFAVWLGVTRTVTSAADVRSMWETLLAREARAAESGLRGHPSTVLDVGAAVVSTRPGGMLDVTLDEQRRMPESVVAVPRFVHALATRKFSNIGHWMLDCLPQVSALRRVEPEASILVPPGLKPFHQAGLALTGVAPDRIRPWDGSPVAASRVLVFESDGRLGGGRPLSALIDMRRDIAAARSGPPSPGRRLYVSRRDARRKRQWATNEPDLEQFFANRGFEIICPPDHSLPELIQMFGEASVVAGLNGAGLSYILFAPAGAHVVVLLTNSLLRWYAREGDSRSLWLSGEPASGELAALGDSPRFFAHVAAAFEQHCHSFVSDETVPVGELAQFLDEVLDVAGRPPQR
jgi:hypothetical protein